MNASEIFRMCNIDPKMNFFALSSWQVDSLLSYAVKARYYAPKNANGSRARYYHAKLIRELNRN